MREMTALAARQVWGVAALVRAVADTLAARFGAVTVRGEVSAFTRAASGHCYFSLQDETGSALLRCAMFRRAASLLDFVPGEGQLVEVRGRLAVYEPRGDLQFVVESMRSAGAGALYEQFLRLKAKLEAEGLFDAERKRELAAFPRRVGVVTSLAAAALHDVLTALARRAPHVEVIVYPSAVQGADAPQQLVDALARAGQRAEVDTLLLCRGGGSLEDLWSFNDERLVRAVAACPIPVICGVGHETDVTLADLAADLRAPTPTAAAELAAPARAELFDALFALAAHARRSVARRLDSDAQRLDHLTLRLARPTDALLRHRHRLTLIAQRLRAAATQRVGLQQQAMLHADERLLRGLRAGLEARQLRMQALAARLDLLDPRQVLARGYALVETAQGELVTAPEQLHAGMELQVSLAQGQAELRVQSARRK